MPRKSSTNQAPIAGARPQLAFRPLTPKLLEAFGEVLRGSWGRGCWCMYPRFTDAQLRELPGEGSASQRQRDAMTQLARRRRAPGLLAFEGDEPVGWVAIAPRMRTPDASRLRARRLASMTRTSGLFPVLPCAKRPVAAASRLL